MDSSAIVEMVDGDDSDYEVNFADVKQDSPRTADKGAPAEKGIMDDTKAQVAQNVTSYVFEASKQKARQWFDVYGKIDILRPYFDVEPHIVRARLLQSLIPKKPTAERVQVARELYGPTMIILTLIALLLFQMKMADHAVQEGTLMGSAFGTCFGYWLGISSLTWLLAYVCNTHITMLQILSLLGYALFGHCIVLFMGTVMHTSHDHMFFYFMWAVFGGLSTLKMVSVLMSRTAGNTQKLIVCGVVATFHLLFLLYLHFAYHQIVEDLNDLLVEPVRKAVAPQNPEVQGVLDLVAREQNKVAVGGPDVANEAAGNVVHTATEAVKRVIRNATPKNDTLIQGGSKILNAFVHKSNTTLDQVVPAIVQAKNATKLG